MSEHFNLFGIKIPGKIEHKDSFKFKDSLYRNAVLFDCKMHDYYKFLCSDEPFKAIDTHNGKSFKYEISSGDSSFKGGTYEDFKSENINLSHFHEASRQLSMHKIWKNLSDKFDKISARKRIKSSYDGEWDYDKRFDIEPFTRRAINERVSRIVKFYIGVSFSGGVSAIEINRFGGFIGALANILERNGVLAELNLQKVTTNFLISVPINEISIATWNIKKADEYMPINRLLKVFSSSWYRRAGFSTTAMASEVLAGRIDSSCLGQPYAYKKVWEKVGDDIYIYSNPSSDQQEAILTQLIEMIGEKK